MNKENDPKKEKTQSLVDVVQNQKPPTVKPDPETLHTTDPQDNMEGPVSSIMQGIKDAAEDLSSDESPGDALKRKDEEL